MPNLRDKLIYMLMYFCGMRISEVFNLRLWNIYFGRRAIKIVQSKRKKDRYVVIPKILEVYLKRYLNKHYFLWDDLIFPSPKKGHNKTYTYHCGYWSRRLRKYCIYAGIKKWKGINCYSLRHSYATHLWEQGVDVLIIKELLGHKYIETTYKYYIHLISKFKIKAVDKAFN
jgi:integrase/recombinase XerD